MKHQGLEGSFEEEPEPPQERAFGRLVYLQDRQLCKLDSNPVGMDEDTELDFLEKHIYT